MPQHVAEAEQPPPVLARHDLAVLAEVRDVGDFGRQPPVFVAPYIGVGEFQRAEIAAEGELLRVVNLLVGKDQHGKFVHARDDLADLPLGHGVAQVDAGNLAGEERAVDRVDRADLQSHVGKPRQSERVTR